MYFAVSCLISFIKLTKMKMTERSLDYSRMLKENPELYQLYKDLVKGEIITAEEFWENRKPVGKTKFTSI